MEKREADVSWWSQGWQGRQSSTGGGNDVSGGGDDVRCEGGGPANPHAHACDSARHRDARRAARCAASLQAAMAAAVRGSTESSIGDWDAAGVAWEVGEDNTGGDIVVVWLLRLHVVPLVFVEASHSITVAPSLVAVVVVQADKAARRNCE